MTVHQRTTANRAILIWFLHTLLEPPVPLRAQWPQHLGPQRNGVSQESTELFSTEPNRAWTVPVGAGFAGVSIVSGQIFLFDRQGDRERLSALDAEGGTQLWSSSYPTSYRDDFGFDEGPRAVPTVAGDQVFTYGAEGKLSAFGGSDGELLWQVDTMVRYGVDKAFFGVGSAPLVVGDRVLLNVGGAQGAGVVAFDRSDGTEVWRSTNDAASYSSPVSFGQQAVFVTREGLLGIDTTSGNELYRMRFRSRLRASVNAANPVLVEEDGGPYVFLTASYGTGAALVRIPDNGSEPTPIWQSRDVLASHYATPIIIGDSIYGVHGRAEYGGELRRVRLRDGKLLWTFDSSHGQLLFADGRLIIVTDDGELIWGAAGGEQFNPQGRAEIASGTLRAAPALANGVLYVRTAEELIAVSLR